MSLYAYSVHPGLSQPSTNLSLPPNHSCGKDGHSHVWNTSGELMIERCEHLCRLCTGEKANHYWKSGWHLRRHVTEMHAGYDKDGNAKQFPDLIVSDGWSKRPSGNTRPVNKKRAPPGSNKKRVGSKGSRVTTGETKAGNISYALAHADPDSYIISRPVSQQSSVLYSSASRYSPSLETDATSHSSVTPGNNHYLMHSEMSSSADGLQLGELEYTLATALMADAPTDRSTSASDVTRLPISQYASPSQHTNFRVYPYSYDSKAYLPPTGSPYRSMSTSEAGTTATTLEQAVELVKRMSPAEAASLLQTYGSMHSSTSTQAVDSFDNQDTFFGSETASHEVFPDALYPAVPPLQLDSVTTATNSIQAESKDSLAGVLDDTSVYDFDLVGDSFMDTLDPAFDSYMDSYVANWNISP